MLLGGAPQEQRCGHDARKRDDGDECHGHHQAETGRVSRRYPLGRHLVHQPCLTAERDVSNINARLEVNGGRSGFRDAQGLIDNRGRTSCRTREAALAAMSLLPPANGIACI